MQRTQTQNRSGSRNNGSRFSIRASQPVSVKQSYGMLKQTRQMVMNDGVKRLRQNHQLVSIPNHNYQSKHQRVFRVFVGPGVANGIAINYSSILAAVRAELGYPADSTTAISVAVHELRVYQASPQTFGGTAATQNALAVRLFDNQANLVGLFEDMASPSGIASVSVAYPVNSRPTFTGSSTSSAVASVVGPSVSLEVVDVLATVIITPGTLPSMMYDPDSDPETLLRVPADDTKSLF